MATYEGGCHCGIVRVKVTKSEPVTKLIDCNCSICRKKGILHMPTEDTEFQVVNGDDALELYQFKSNTAKHWFCKHCGIHVFGRPRNHPYRYTVNARCMDDFLTLMEGAEVVPFDGVNHPKDQ